MVLEKLSEEGEKYFSSKGGAAVSFRPVLSRARFGTSFEFAADLFERGSKQGNSERG